MHAWFNASSQNGDLMNIRRQSNINCVGIRRIIVGGSAIKSEQQQSLREDKKKREKKRKWSTNKREKERKKNQDRWTRWVRKRSGPFQPQNNLWWGQPAPSSTAFYLSQRNVVATDFKTSPVPLSMTITWLIIIRSICPDRQFVSSTDSPLSSDFFTVAQRKYNWLWSSVIRTLLALKKFIGASVGV